MRTMEGAHRDCPLRDDVNIGAATDDTSVGYEETGFWHAASPSARTLSATNSVTSARTSQSPVTKMSVSRSWHSLFPDEEERAAFPRARHPESHKSSYFVLACWMLLAGSANTLSTKFADMQCVPEVLSPAAPDSCGVDWIHHAATASECAQGCKPFVHPILQAVGAFIGEMLCLVVFRLKGVDTNPSHACERTGPKGNRAQQEGSVCAESGVVMSAHNSQEHGERCSPCLI